MLYVHRSERADLLAEQLAQILGEPLDDPLTPELVAVPTRGVERWLTQRLSQQLGCSGGRSDGVAANIDFPFPGTLVGRSVAAATGLDPGTDPWSPERAVWPLLGVVDEHLGAPFLEPLAGYLRASSPTREDGALTRFAAVRHVADLYDQYSVHRPGLIRTWAGGEYGDVPDRHRWQADLWRHLRERIGMESPAERLETAAQRIADDPDIVDAPSRISLFGMTRLPASYLLVLKALAEQRDVHLLLLHPSGALWKSVSAASTAPPSGLRRGDDQTASTPRNPLLRSWGRDAREMQLVLAAHQALAGEHLAVPDEPDGKLLHLIQSAVRADRAPEGTAVPPAVDRRPSLEEGDRSLQVHSCHGRYRQVEVLRDALLQLLSADETLEPRDLIVMCPDVEAFAPLVQAVFAGDSTTPSGLSGSPEVRVRLADRSLRQTNPLLGTAAVLLDLAESRLTASQVLDLAGQEPVRRRFRFDDDELAVLERWVVDMGTRWGLDREHRQRWKLGSLAANTWESGLDRLLLGVAMAEQDCRLFEGTLPLDDVASTDVDLAGRFAEYVARLGDAMRNLSGRKPIANWVQDLRNATEALGCADAHDAWQEDQLRRVLEEVASEAAPVDGADTDSVLPELTVPELRAVLTNRLKGRPTRANFRTGDLTVCTLVPMRSVPHRVVCLLGLDDGVFPRHPERDGDDIISADPHVGDRDARSEDRQLLLDALLAATDHLLITYSGRDERTNRPKPPAVPIAELLDTIDQTVRPPEGFGRARDAVVVQHPLQSFDPRNFTARALGAPGPWSFNRVDLEGAQALVGPQRDRLPFIGSQLPDREGSIFPLESLIGFLKSPAQWFLRERLGIYANGTREEPEDGLPIELSSLEEWGIGDRLLKAVLEGAELEAALKVERARGFLPPDPLAGPVLDVVVPAVEQLAQQVRSMPCFESPAISVEINLRLPSGRIVVGTVPGVRDSTVVNCVYSKLGPKHRLESWVRLLAIASSGAVQSAAAVILGRSGSRRAASVAVSELRLNGTNVDPTSSAAAILDRLVDLYERGMREPLPMYCKTSAEWAARYRTGDGSERNAQKAWNGDLFDGESVEEAHLMVLGGRVPFHSIFEASPRPDERGPGWVDSEPSRFGRLSRRLWDDLLDHESPRILA